jgi:hypothetical protein
MLVFWVVMPYELVGRHQYFRGTYCLHLPTSPHGVITQKININIFPAVRTSNLTLSV